MAAMLLSQLFMYLLMLMYLLEQEWFRNIHMESALKKFADLSQGKNILFWIMYGFECLLFRLISLIDLQ